MAKFAALAKETHLRKEAVKAKVNLMVELAALCNQMDKAKANVVPEFRVSQPFFDACGVYCRDGFDYCLK